jgi:ATP-dependent protease HslVU (ClpYQ) peptidase subunit
MKNLKSLALLLATVLSSCSKNDSNNSNPIINYTVSTLAGSTFGFANGAGTLAQFKSPNDVAVDGDGNVYVADYNNLQIRKISKNGEVSTLAGSGIQGFADGAGTSAQFNGVTSLTVDATGNVYVADTSNHKIRKITPDGKVTTLAGGTAGFLDGTSISAKFSYPTGVALDAAGNVYVADGNNQKIRKITPDGEVTTLAGSTIGFADGIGTEAKFNNPTRVAVDATGNVYVSDDNNNKIRKITPAGTVTTLAGSTRGSEDGSATTAQFGYLYGLAVDRVGNVYVADTGNHRIRKITPSGTVSTLVGSKPGFEDGSITVAKFNSPKGVALDAAGNVYVADSENNKIRKISQD